jgi:pimeloyl-ACP methyl ester carboxylesterase
MAKDALRLMDHLNIKKAHILGYSLGGAITEYLLVNHPDRFITATIGGMGWVKPDDERVALIDEFATAIETGKGLRPFLERVQPERDSKQANANTDISGAIQSILTNNPRALMACVRGIPGLVVTEEQLKANKVPALAIVGGADPWKATVDNMEKVMSNLKVQLVPGANHDTCVGSPEFVDDVLAFINDHR